MLLRIVALVGAVGPALAPFVAPGHALPVALGAMVGAVVVLALTKRRELAAAGLVLAGAGAAVAPSAHDLLPLTGLGAGVPTVDLAAAPFPDPSPAYVEVRGWYRDQWTLDEYATAPGERPDQATTAPAVLVPFVGTTDDVVALRGAIVVARVAGGTRLSPNASTITGRVRPLPDEALGALVAIARPAGSEGDIRGVIVDTLDAPRGGEAWTRLALVALLALASLGCLGIAAGSRRR
ncbi:MAG: hypothetical protein AAF721_25260 [Myxococcota bacterium]